MYDRVKLTQHDLMQEVMNRTGIRNVYEESLNDRIKPILHQLNHDYSLNLIEKKVACKTLINLLVKRTQFFSALERNPEILQEKIEKPIFITGMPRSGTTFMQYLMTSNSNHRGPLLWEVSQPSSFLADDGDVRVDLATKEVSSFCNKIPSVMLSHPYYDEGAKMLVECEIIPALDFRHFYSQYYVDIPYSINAKPNGDANGYFDFHKKTLQSLQWNQPKKQWVLKGTEHHFRLDALKKIYPDAIIIWMHRDPLKVIPSVMKLLSNWTEDTYGKENVNRAEVGQHFANHYIDMLNQALSNKMVEHEDVKHILYADFIANPVKKIQNIYDDVGLEFDKSAEESIMNWLGNSANKGDRYGKFSYSINEFDMTDEDLDRRLLHYRERFSIPYE